MPQIVKYNGKFIKQHELVEDTPEGPITHYIFEYQGVRYTTLEALDSAMDGTKPETKKKVLKKKTKGKKTIIRKEYSGSSE